LNEQRLNHYLNTMDNINGDETLYISSSNLSNQSNNLPTINGYLMNYNQSLENDCVFNQNETVSAPSSVSEPMNLICILCLKVHSLTTRSVIQIEI
jgi:hypothetical protein